jgi:hypothetical protein
VNAYRTKLLLCALLAIPLLTAGAQGIQRIHRPALGNEILAKQHSAKFLAERGVYARLPGGSSPAEVLAQSRARYRQQVQQLVASGVSVPAWQPLGPAQVSTPAYGAVTGRVTSIAADSSDPTGNTIYVGTASGGVWKSTSAAGDPASVSLVPLTDYVYSSLSQKVQVPSLSIGAVSVQPVAPGATPVLLAGTGEPNDTTASYLGSGILRSTDGGSQWTLITNSSDMGVDADVNFDFSGNGFAGFAWGTVGGNPVVVAAVSRAKQGIEVTLPGSLDDILGIYYSKDLGKTWFMATITDAGGAVVQSPTTAFIPCQGGDSRQPCGNAVTSIVWNPVRKVFLAAVRFHGYYQSTDGQNWTRLTNQPGANLTPAMCPSQPGYSGSQACPIYNGALAVQPVSGDTFALTTDINNLDQGLWQDACNAGSGACASSTLAFTQIDDTALEAGTLNPAQPTLIPQADYDLYLAAVPSQQSGQPDTLLFAGTADIYRCDLGTGCAWRNTTHAQSSDCNSAHVAPAQYAVDATFGANGLLYFGNDGGLWRTTDAVDEQGNQCSADDATHFQNLNSGFTGSISDVADIAPDPTDPQIMMVSLGPLGTAAPLSDGGAWHQVLNGEGDFAAIDPAAPQNWYATSEFGIGINLCTSGSSCGITAFGQPVIASADVSNDGYGQIIPAPWILDPQNTSNIILGTCRVWRGPAVGGVQSPVSTMLDGNNGPYCDGNAEIRSLAASGSASDSSGTPERIYAGMAGLYDGGATVAGHVFAQTIAPGGSASSWVDLSNNLYQFNPNGFDISSVYADPHSAGGQTVYVTVQGVGGLHVYRSIDGGSIWQDISRGLPQSPTNSIVVDPNDANTVYVATDAGVYYTQNVTGCLQPTQPCWSPFGTSLPNVPVTELSLASNASGPVLLAATYGRGVWQIGLPNQAVTTATVAPTSLAFGDQAVQTTSAPQQLLVTNTGSVPLTISNVTITGDFTDDGTCNGESIAPGNACIIEVSFAPTQVGAASGVLTIFGNLSGGGQITVPLSGNGTAGAAITLTPSSLCFQPTLVGQTTSTACDSSTPSGTGQSILIANTGGSAATLTSISISGDFAIVANTCGSSLAAANTAGDSCTVSITFTPTVSGSRTGVLTVLDSAGKQTAQLSGTGQTPATDVLSPSSLTFSAQTVGTTSAAQQVTLTNNGDAALKSIVAQTSSSDFSVADNCGGSLAGHSSCALLVSFLPSTVGSVTGTLTVSDAIDEGGSVTTHVQQVSLAGTGVAPAGKVSVSPGSVDFGYYAVGGSSPARLVTITNNGSAAITGLTSAITGDFSLQPAASNPCGATLATGASCNLAVVFSPIQVNARSGSLTITADNLSTPFIVALSGSGAEFTIDGPSSALVAGGKSSTSYTVNINSVNGSKGPVSLACSVQPSTATCSVSPATVTLIGDGSPQPATVTFTVSQQARASGSEWSRVGLALALLFPLGFLGKRRRGWGALAALLCLALLLPIGCGVASSAGSDSGGGSGGGSGSSSTYTVTVTGSVPGLTKKVETQVTVD